MATIPPDRVADALHTEYDDLPSGYAEDITTAEHVIETYVEPNAEDPEAEIIETVGVYVAAAFIGGTEGDAPLSSVETETAGYRIDVANMSAEARDHWARATMLDPTDALEDAASDSSADPVFSFESMGRK